LNMKFWKLSGAGNDFIALDNRDGAIPEAWKKQLATRWCPRAHSIGADGLLLIEPSQRTHFTMRIFNADGSEAETCGNASRCIARLALSLGLAPQDMTFETHAGVYRAHVEGDAVSVSIPDPRDIRIDLSLKEEWLPVPRFHSINTGVPHVVLFVDQLNEIDVTGIGRKLRRHPMFHPSGTNVNFVKVKDQSNLEIRTYERGVEDETLACGTGCIAAAIVAGISGLAQSPVRLHTRGGLINTVSFSLEEPITTNIRLEGDARIIYRGEIDIDPESLKEKAAAPVEHDG